MGIFKGRLRFFMKSGNVVEIKCKDFEMSRLSSSSNRSLTIEGADRVWSIDVSEVEAVTFK